MRPAHLLTCSLALALSGCATAGAGAFDDVSRAVRNNQVNSVRSALSSGLTVRQTDDGGNSLLHLACQYRQSTDVAQMLLTEGANLHARNGLGYTPLHLCALNGCVATARLLIKAGAKKDAKDNAGLTPYDRAKWVKQQAMIELLAP